MSYQEAKTSVLKLELFQCSLVVRKWFFEALNQIGSHAGHEGNELADSLANIGKQDHEPSGFSHLPPQRAEITPLSRL